MIVFGFIYSLRYIFTKRFWNNLRRKIFYTGELWDMAANVWACEIGNDFFISESNNEYGDRDDTISDITGRNERDNTLTPFGVKFTRFLDVLGKNHSIESIEE